jgi:hypothetical protein
MNKPTKVKAGLKPQEFEHRTAVAIEALAAALAGAQLLAAFLLEQQGPEWRSQGPKAAAAAREFRRAGRWLKTIDRYD